MATTALHPFLRILVDKALFGMPVEEKDKRQFVLETTGPLMVSRMYQEQGKQLGVKALPAELVAPLGHNEVRCLIRGEVSTSMEEKVEMSHAIHYFFGSWL